MTDDLIERLRATETDSAGISHALLREAADALAQCRESVRQGVADAKKHMDEITSVRAENGQLKVEMEKEICPDGYEFVSTKPEMSKYMTILRTERDEARAELERLKEIRGTENVLAEGHIFSLRAEVERAQARNLKLVAMKVEWSARIAELEGALKEKGSPPLLILKAKDPNAPAQF